MPQRGAAALASSPQDDELMTLEEVLQFFGGRQRPIHHTTLYRGMRAGRYPDRIHVGPQTVRWLRSECLAARQRLIDARDGRVPRNQSEQIEGV